MPASNWRSARWSGGPDLKVLYTTGQGVTDGMLALFVPCSEVLPKPYTVDQLQGVLAKGFGIVSS